MARSLILMVFALTGCAFLNRDNTPALNWVEGSLLPAPEQPTARVLMYPVVFPVGLIAVTIDALIVHPASVVGDAIDDTGDALWRRFDWDHAYVTACVSLPWRALATPIVLSGDFLGRALFDISRRAHEARTKEKQEPQAARREPPVQDCEAELVQCDQLMQQGKAAEALGRLAKARIEDWPTESRGRAQATLLRAAYQCGHYEWFTFGPILTVHASAGEAVKTLLAEMANDADPYARWKAIWFQLVAWHFPVPQESLLRVGLDDASAFVRYSALSFIRDADRRMRLDYARVLRAELSAIAEHDQETMNRAAAAEVLRQLDR